MFRDLYLHLASGQLLPWLEWLPARLSQWEQAELSDRDRAWLRRVQNLPQVAAVRAELRERVALVSEQLLSAGLTAHIRQVLTGLQPWRKGPFDFFGLSVDAEWRSDWKWARLSERISPLQDRHVLDIGCGNGYYLWRMRGAGAASVIGADPSALFLAQFLSFRHFYPDPAVHLVPLGIEDLVPQPLFDTVFAMGVLYHRRSPLDFLSALRQHLCPGGELVLETLVIEGDAQQVLVPQERYACMRNVWFIPSLAMLELWLRRTGFKQVTLIDLSPTTPAEQRRTAWMTGQSLSDFLDPHDFSRTVEGYPAPLRAIIRASV
jgi:tRNA (mo5U34)-methyltransferase